MYIYIYNKYIYIYGGLGREDWAYISYLTTVFSNQEGLDSLAHFSLSTVIVGSSCHSLVTTSVSGLRQLTGIPALYL